MFQNPLKSRMCFTINEQRKRPSLPSPLGFPAALRQSLKSSRRRPREYPDQSCPPPPGLLVNGKKKSPEIVTEITEMIVEFMEIQPTATRFTISMGWTGHSSPEGVCFLEPAINLTAYAPRYDWTANLSSPLFRDGFSWFLMVSH